jgi:hypothetical protein
MKTKKFPLIILRLVICFLVPYLTMFSISVSAQSIYQVNGRTILKNNSQYFDITTGDSIMVDTKHLTIEFHQSKESIGQSEIITQYNAKLFHSSINKQFFFTLDTLNDYISTLTNIISEENISKVYLSYKFKGNFADYLSSVMTNNMNNTIPDDPYFDPDYNNAYLTNMQMPEAWSIETGKSTIRVGFIGLGCDWNCADLPPYNSIGYNFFDESSNTFPILPFQTIMHWASHQGTRETSVISARTNNNLYMSGIAGGWNGNGGIIPVQYVVGEILGLDVYYYTSFIAAAIDKSVEDDVKVINFTLNPPPSADISSAIQNAYDKGVVIVASVGKYFYNDDHSILFPATEEHVIAVGGTELTMDQLSVGDRYYYDEKKWYGYPSGSRFGSGLEVTANAKNVVTLSGYILPFGPQTTNVMYDLGTEYSTSIVSGVAALILSANNCLSPNEVEKILINSCEKLGGYSYNSSGWCNELGYGRVNAKTAVELAMGEPGKILTFNETWDHNRSFRGDIIVPNGKTLTLQNMTLKMWENAGITVNKGGTLNIINSTITATCMGMWKGITVEGDNALTQYYNSNQGYLSMQNSTIIHAKNGITTTTGGGIIQATNSQFENNTKSLNIGQYSQPNYRTSFSVCDFIVTNEHRDWANFQHIAHINMNSGAKFYGCTFSNNNTLHPNIGNGIYSTGANYTVKSSCTNPLISPCPEANLIKSQFSNLEYGTKGYYTSNKILIDLAEFNNNICGIYLSNCSFADILNCKFTVPEFYAPSGKVPYGAYLNYCSAYHVEKNDYIGVNANTTGNIGLYIYNSGGAQNYVYNNTFNNLSRATVADGANRVTGGATGLCYKCNDFTSNGTDIDIVRANNTALLSTHGIALNQGLPSAGSASTNKDSLAASNTFSQSQYVWNIHNNNNSSNYYYQQYKNPISVKILPSPVYNIGMFVNYNTTYYKPQVCKTWITAGGIISSQLLVEKDAAKANAETVTMQLQNTLDGGNTSSLTFDIIGSIPPEALDLRDELLQKSPYLSDTVLKTTIQQENVLPNAMVRDILIANPQAAKSEDIMAKLDERWEPMPDYMKEEIETGIAVIGGREQLEALRDGWKQQESFLFNRIIGNYLSDTVNQNAITELKTYLQSENTAQAGFTLVDLNLHQNDYVGAIQAISTMQANLTLTAYESQQAIDYLTLAGILQGLQTDTIALYALDSTNAIPMFTLYNSSENKATAIARDILITAGLLDYQEPINGGDYSKSGSIEMTTTKPGSSTKHSVDQLSVFPNPANTYSILEYVLPANISSADIRICTQSGIQIWQQDIKKVRDQIIVDLTGFSTGSYLVTLNTGMKTISSKSLIISR